MKRFEWVAHRQTWCERCRHMKPRLGCPVFDYMEKNSEDVVANRLFERLGRCSQFEKKPERQKTRLSSVRKGKTR